MILRRSEQSKSLLGRGLEADCMTLPTRCYRWRCRVGCLSDLERSGHSLGSLGPLWK
jgi:hypothetical protein